MSCCNVYVLETNLQGSAGTGDKTYRPLIAWLTYLAQGSQDTTTVSNEFQSVASAASVVAVWRVVCQEPTEKLWVPSVFL